MARILYQEKHKLEGTSFWIRIHLKVSATMLIWSPSFEE
jgi:hypothetical protein